MARFTFSQPLDCFSCNVRGLKNPERLVEICDIAKNKSKSKNNIISIQETKIQNLKEEHKRVLKNFKLTYEIVPARGTAGGLLTLFPESLNVKPVIKTDNVLALALNQKGPIICNVYINPKDYHMRAFEIACEDLREISENGILVMGDFNAIEPNQHYEKGKMFPKNNDIRITRYLRISRFLNYFNAFDLGKTLGMMENTHFDKRTRADTRIDYFFGNINVQNSKMSIHSTSFSDHKCLHLNCFTNENQIGNGSWKLNNEILLKEAEIKEIILNCFEKTSDMARKYDIYKSRLRDLLRLLCIRNAKEKNFLDLKLEREVEISTKNLHSKKVCSKNDLEEHEEKVEKLKSFRSARAKVFLQSMKNFYLDVNEGDPKSTKSMLRKLAEKREIRKVINSEGVTIEDESDILDEFARYFEKCYKRPNDRNKIEQKLYVRKKHLHKFFKKNKTILEDYKLQNEIQNDEDSPITELEVEKAIIKLNSKSAPGSDGLSSDLYKTQKEVFIPILTELFNKIHETHYVPPSFKQAIIKLIPKKPNCVNIENFRPISLINTDQKILSHIIADRLRKVLNVLIGRHQTAHLTKRNINTSLMKLQKFATEMSKREGIVALDFNKAFDKVNREYLMEMIGRLPLDCQTKNIINKTYEETIALINIRGSFSIPFKTETGVRQGCPMSALMFNLAIEPLLQRIQNTNFIKSSQETKSIAFADDISICMYTSSIGNLFAILKDFADMSDLTVNINKSKMITAGKLYKEEKWKLQKVKRAKILGLYINVGGKLDNETKNEMMSTAVKTAQFMGPTVSLYARAKNIETFVLPKLIYSLRHYPKSKTFLKKLNAVIINQLWLDKKHNVNQEIVNTPHQEGGIGLRNLQKLILTAKLMDLKNLAFCELEKSFIPTYKNSKAFSNLFNDLKHDGIEILNFDIRTLSFNYFFQSFEVTEKTTFKEIYKFLIESVIAIPCFRNINMSAMKLKISPNIIMDFIKKLWKNRRLKSFDKNILYNFLMNSYLEKQEKWLKQLVTHPLCFACGEKFETWDHLLFECREFSKTRNLLNLKNWSDVFTDKTGLAPKLLVAIVLSSWTEEKGNYLKFLTK